MNIFKIIRRVQLMLAYLCLAFMSQTFGIEVANKKNLAVKIKNPEKFEIKNVANELNNFFTERGFLVVASNKKPKKLQTCLTVTTEKHLNKSWLCVKMSG